VCHILKDQSRRKSKMDGRIHVGTRHADILFCEVIVRSQFDNV